MTKFRWPVVLFDLDGTLIDTIGLIVASLRHTHKTVLGDELDQATAKSWIGIPLTKMFDEHGPEVSARMREVYMRHNIAELPRLQRCVPGMEELVDELVGAGVLAAVATSKRRDSAERSMALAGMTGKVELTTTFEDTRLHKPLPDPLRRTLRVLGRAAAEAVYVGDSVYDVRCAKACGVDQIAVTWGAGTADELAAERPTALVDDVAELRAAMLV